jgi:flavin-dependent dehydrogenase
MPAPRPRKSPARSRKKAAAPAPPKRKPPQFARRPAARAKGARTAASDLFSQASVLVIGDHPSAALCALMLHEAKIPVALVDIGSTPNPDRLVTINPAFFRLHKPLESLVSKLELASVSYARFLGPGGESAQSQPARTDGKARRPDVLAYIGSMVEMRLALRNLAISAGVPWVKASFAAEAVDERGPHVRVDGQSLNPRILAVADPLPEEAALLLDLPRFPGRGSSIQATARLAGPGTVFGPAADAQALTLTLDLGRQLQWGWLLRRGEEAQLCVQCPPEGDVPALLEEWIHLLKRQQVITPEAHVDLKSLRLADLPLGGALMRDVVARRTLLLGPAGGFYSASGEDVYPACWSAKYAAEIAARAVKADHPQDALGAYRGRWGATLGDYLRGPQQNLRFLLPLMYKNPVMTDRLAEAILLGRSLVK